MKEAAVVGAGVGRRGFCVAGNWALGKVVCCCCWGTKLAWLLVNSVAESDAPSRWSVATAKLKLTGC